MEAREPVFPLKIYDSPWNAIRLACLPFFLVVVSAIGVYDAATGPAFPFTFSKFPIDSPAVGGTDNSGNVFFLIFGPILFIASLILTLRWAAPAFDGKPAIEVDEGGISFNRNGYGRTAWNELADIRTVPRMNVDDKKSPLLLILVPRDRWRILTEVSGDAYKRGVASFDRYGGFAFVLDPGLPEAICSYGKRFIDAESREPAEVASGAD